MDKILPLVGRFTRKLKGTQGIRVVIGAQGRNRTTDTRIFRGIGNLYFFIFQ